jgi:hypothetical protein
VSIEIERKFRLHRQPESLGDCCSMPIEQGYLAIEGGGGAEADATGRRS